MPESFIFLILLILVPLALMGWLSKREYASRLEALFVTVFTGLLVVFLFQWGQYPYVGSYYLRYVLLVLMGGTVFIVFSAVRERPWYMKSGWKKRILLGFSVAGSLILVPLTWSAFQAHYIDIPSVNMAFPLQGSNYYISSGGSNSVLNLHYKPQTPGQMYAIDIEKLDGWGRYTRNLIRNQLEDYLIFGETVISPCDGRVIEVRNEVSDHPPFEYDPVSGSGNYVLIESNGGYHVFLLHLMQGSVLVQSGDRVVVAEPIGRVGNSGFSTEPHLHIQVSQVTQTDSLAPEVGVPVLFRGQFLVRNSLFSN